MASVLKVDRIETPSGTGNISLAQPISGDGSQLTGITAGTPADDSVTGAKIDLSLVAGDIMYASGVDVLERLPKGTDGELLTLASGVPSWAGVTVPDDSVTGGKIDLSLVAGDIIYSDATDSIERLAKGTDGEVLTLASGVPSWAAAAEGGAWTMLKHDNLSGVLEVEYSSTYITSTYKTYVLAYDISVAPNASGLFFKTSTDNGTSYAGTSGDYMWSQPYVLNAASGASVWQYNASDSFGVIQFGYWHNTGNNNHIAGFLYIHEPMNSAVKTTVHGSAVGIHGAQIYLTNILNAGIRLAAEENNAIKWYVDNGGTVMTGHSTLYGISHT